MSASASSADSAPGRGRLRSAIWTSGDRLRPVAVYPLLGLVILALGVNWPVMSIGLRSVTPIWMATLRLLAASVALIGFTAISGRLSLPPRGDLPVVLSVALLRLALVFSLIFFALEIVPPGRSSILVWTASLWTIPIAVIFLGERMNPWRWFGLAAGITGIVLVFDPTRLDWTEGRILLGHGMLLVGAMSHAVVSVHIRRHNWVATPLSLLPWQVLVAWVPVLVIALIKEGLPSIDWSVGLVANVAFQGVVVTGFAVWGQMTVLRSHPAISTNLALMTVPAIGLLASALVVGEALGLAVLSGLAFVLIGVAATMTGDLRKRRPRAAS